MATSKMIVHDKCIIKKLANSEANIQNQIRGIKDSSVAAYYLCDIYEFENIKSFFDNVNHVFVDGEKISKYIDDVHSRMGKYRTFYKDNISLAISNMCLLSNNTELSKIEFSKRGERMFFFFSEKSDDDFHFTKSIIGGVTNICFSRRDDTLYVYLELVDNLGVEIFNSKTNVTIEELSKMLDIYIDSYSSVDVGIRKFGIDFCYAIEKENYTPEEIVKNSSHSDTPTYAMAIREGIDLSKVLDNITIIEKDDDYDDSNIEEKSLLNPNRIQGGTNRIFYGIPGCGKSYRVNKIIEDKYPNKEIFTKNVFRTTFYLDYSNSDFIGQLVPKTDKEGNVTYSPNFGPFSKALKRAYETNEMVYLVIEEINRGNAAAIFGDLFQLLDRLDAKKVDERNDGSKVGDSEYPITNTFIEDYLGIENGKVIIPSNLTIFATMNTSDQNVFPLDTAFKRRWKMEKVVDDYKKSNFHNFYVPQENKQELLTWEDFLEDVNDFIVSSEEGFNLDDKQIGSYFVTDEILVDLEIELDDDEYFDRVDQFNYKVLEYLWSDVAKFDRSRWINHKETRLKKTPNSFDELVKMVNQYGLKNILEAFNNDEGE